MNILAVDTSTSTLHICLKTESGLEERKIEGFMQHSEMLLSEIKDLLKRQGIEMKDLNLLVCTRGPGSFTSLRISMATLKGISLAVTCPLVSIPTLKCIAKAAGSSLPTLAVIDAKKKRYYLGLYDSEGKALMEEMDANAVDLLPYIQGMDTLFITGPDAEVFRRKLEEVMPEINLIVDELPIRALGELMVIEGLKQFEAEGADDIGQGPVYIRRSDAEEALLQRMQKENGNG